MRKLIVGALTLASLVPAMAQAQSNQDLRDVRHERQEIRQDDRRGDHRDAREDRRDLRDARQDYRHDLADRDRRWARDDWRGWRDRNPNSFYRGAWRAPFRYYSFRPGVRIQPVYFGSNYVIADPWRYHLPRAGWGQSWVRHYDDVILVDTRRGVVIDVIRGFYR